MAPTFVPDDFHVPMTFVGPGFRLEPLGPEHNERDHPAWMSSIEHIRSTPGWGGENWPHPMSLEENLADLVRHSDDFAGRRGFTYSILDAEDVIGCVYIYPGDSGEVEVSSWVTADRASLDRVVWKNVSAWLDRDWPFASISYASRD
jgi:hypothetical protein